MIIKHDGATPQIDPAAWVAPNAVICGNVTIGPSCRVMFGAQVIAEGDQSASAASASSWRMQFSEVPRAIR
jgi:carbonic anhydrase/acetyltransferase-like protein (isoleucine patch superfamily)